MRECFFGLFSKKNKIKMKVNEVVEYLNQPTEILFVKTINGMTL